MSLQASRVTILKTHIRGLITRLIITHEPPSTVGVWALKFASLMLSNRV